MPATAIQKRPRKKLKAATISKRPRKLADRYWVRMATGVLVSLLVHGFILSLRLGIPGLGLPGIELPWNERRARTPELSILIANPAGPAMQTAQNNASLPVSDSSTPQPPQPQPETQQSSDMQPEADMPDTRVRQAPLKTATHTAKTAKALQSTPALARTVRNAGAPPQVDQSAPLPASAQQALIAFAAGRPSTFVVPATGLDDWWRSAPETDSTPLPFHPPELAAPPAIAMRAPQNTLDIAHDPAPAAQKPVEHESFEHPDALTAKEPEAVKTSEPVVEQAQHAQGEEVAAQEAARTLAQQEAAQRAQDLETRKQEDARRQQEEQEAAARLQAQKQEEENIARENEARAAREAQAQAQAQAAARLAEELAAKKQEELLAAQKQEELKQLALQREREQAEREAKELAARRQAEEIARRQAAALALQKQQEEQRAEEIRKQEQALKEQQALELAAHKQAEQAEERAAQQAQELAAKQAAELAAKQAAELAAAQKAAADALAQSARQAATNGSAGTGTNTTGGNGTGGPGSLAARALQQIGKLGLDREPAMSGTPVHHEDGRQPSSIFGNFDHDIGLRMYVESWRTKIERNGSLNYSQSSKDKAREDPVVTVAIRSDGSVEDIVFNRSSGRADLDEAVRRIVRVNAPYSAFPASLARKYDVIPIRRIWNFDESLHIMEEVHQE